MQIEDIEIKSFSYSGFSTDRVEKAPHIKTLPYLSIVQSKTGSYLIGIDGEKPQETGEGGFFIAPSRRLQTILHLKNEENGLFEARFAFFDVLVNGKYRLDDVMEFKLIADKNFAEKLNEVFDEYETAKNPCDKKICQYKILKCLTDKGNIREKCRNAELYRLMNYISKNYSKKITIRDMAEVMNMSESNLYAVFKKETGVSPNRYLTDYRLSVSVDMLIRGTDSIEHIAESVGINDRFYFSRIFKKKYLVSPAKYRKNSY